MAMARGSRAYQRQEEDFYDFIGEKELRPSRQSRPAGPRRHLLPFGILPTHPDAVAAKQRQCRTFVEQPTNSASVVAARIAALW